jgi:hypothetical protein
VVAEFIGEGKNLERAGEIEHLDVVENQNGDVFLHAKTSKSLSVIIASRVLPDVS